jgi:hypothetical protein
MIKIQNEIKEFKKGKRKSDFAFLSIRGASKGQV